MRTKGTVTVWLTYQGRKCTCNDLAKLVGKAVVTIRARAQEGFSGDEIVAIYTTNRGLCPGCGVSVYGKRTLYCSKCSPQGKDVTCITCGTIFRANRNQQYCSANCRQRIALQTGELESDIERDKHCLQRVGKRVVPCKHYHRWLDADSQFCCATTVSHCRGYEVGEPSRVDVAFLASKEPQNIFIHKEDK